MFTRGSQTAQLLKSRSTRCTRAHQNLKESKLMCATQFDVITTQRQNDLIAFFIVTTALLPLVSHSSRAASQLLITRAHNLPIRHQEQSDSKLSFLSLSTCQNATKTLCDKVVRTTVGNKTCEIMRIVIKSPTVNSITQRAYIRKTVLMKLMPRRKCTSFRSRLPRIF